MNQNEILQQFEKLSGIYIILNKLTQKIYIGESLDIKNRWTQHLEKLENGMHENPDIQQDYNKYGSEGFECKILQIHVDRNVISTKAKIIILENWWINYFSNKKYTLYNKFPTLENILKNDTYIGNNEKLNYLICKSVKKFVKYHILVVDGFPYIANTKTEQDKKITQSKLLKLLKENNTLSSDYTLSKMQSLFVKLGIYKQVGVKEYAPAEKFKDLIFTKDNHHIQVKNEAIELIEDLIVNNQ